MGGLIVHGIRGLVSSLVSLSPQEAAIDAGLTAVIIAGTVGLTWGLDWLLRRGVQRLAAKGLVAGQTAREGPKAAVASQGLLKLAIVVGAALLVLQVWGLAPLGWLGGPAGAASLRLVVLIVLGFGVVDICGRIIDRLFHGLASRTDDRRRAAQFQTLAPLVKGVATGCLAIFIGLTVLSELGVKIAPLLAGAGVVGVALGFGAQTLVKDFITGLFLILEDIVSVGDNVKIGEFGGLVETMTLRTIRLRDFDGVLHVFPYSEAQVIHNRTKSFSYAVFEPRISYVADIEQATGVMRKVGEQLRADPSLANLILEPLEVVGVDQFTDVGLVVKARIKTRPGDQWKVQREYNRRLKLAFDAAHVEIGYPNVQADRSFVDGRGDPAQDDPPAQAH
ncbi:MAG TPA: mechanosensitive ion channel family protein [Caulobacteraceae bacterium]|nr:mechanosensitive ion channel family protein [Caulobacteraceae bacterium]